jgi:hypothetical protein
MLVLRPKPGNDGCCGTIYAIYPNDLVGTLYDVSLVNAYSINPDSGKLL